MPPIKQMLQHNI